MITQERLNQILRYDPSTGNFINKFTRGPNAKEGEVAGRIDSSGYKNLTIDGISYLAHRLVWLYFTGEWPSETIDHINREKLDNRIENLRLATRSQNLANTTHRPPPKASGVKGVYKRPRLKGWCASITVNRQNIYLGSFPTIEQASEAYKKAAREFFGDFATTDGTYTPKEVVEGLDL